MVRKGRDVAVVRGVIPTAHGLALRGVKVKSVFEPMNIRLGNHVLGNM